MPQPATDPVLEEYAQLASRYDRKWAFYIEATTRATLARMGVRPGEVILDVGCGTGALLDALLQACPDLRLAGVDPSAEMLAVARRKLTEEVELHPAAAHELPFPSETFDLVVSCNVFHYLRQPLAALEEMNRVLRKAGRLVITDWCDDYLACRLCDLYLRLFNRAHFQVYSQDRCASLLREAGHVDIRIERYKISRLWGLMTAVTRKHSPTLPEPAADRSVSTGRQLPPKPGTS